MIELGIDKLGKSFGVTPLFDNLDFDIKTKDRVGVVGANGVGKTTLLKMIYGTEGISNGNIHKRKGLKVGYLEQIPNYEDNMTSFDIIKLAFEEIYVIESNLKDLRQKMAEKIELEETIQLYSNLEEKLNYYGDYETKINKIIKGLNFSEELLKNKFNLLSGGEKSRILLGKLLLEEPDLLLLDEPSNHLDMDSIEWLEKYLINYKGSVLIVSHDRYFLDKVANKIVEIRKSKCDSYIGNYSKYVVERELRLINELKTYENQQKKIAKMQEQIKRYRIWGEMRDSDKMYRRAKELEKRLEKLDQISRPVYDRKINSFSLSSSDRTGKIVVACENIGKSFSEKLIFEDINFEVRYGDSVAVLGANGIGKSTLLKIICKELEADDGYCKIGANVNIGYLSQDVVFPEEKETVLEYFSGKYNITYGETRKELAKIMMYEDDVYKSIASLSGGEKTRLKLLTLMYEKFNVLILDEPTNHLDIESREALESDLINYDGTIIFVSHDRYFVEKVATRIFHIENKGLKSFEFGYNEYMESIRNSYKLCLEENKESSSDKDDYLESKQKIRLKEKKIRDFKKLEAEIDSLDIEIKNLEKMLYSEKDTIKLVELNNNFEDKKIEIDQKFILLEEMYDDSDLADII